MSSFTLFFTRYLLTPILIGIGTFVLKTRAKAKGKTKIKLKLLLVFFAFTGAIISSVGLLGFLKYDFIWTGIIASIIIYLLLGYGLYAYTKTNSFKSIGFNQQIAPILLGKLICTLLGAWIYYFIFNYTSNLNYGYWAMSLCSWVLIPSLFIYALEYYHKIPILFYEHWVVDTSKIDINYWKHIDTFKLMQVNLKVKRSHYDRQLASFSVKIPQDIPLGKWFDKVVDDPNLSQSGRIQITTEDDLNYGWIFYTSKWLKTPVFTRVLDAKKTAQENKINNRAIIYAKRVAVENDED